MQIILYAQPWEACGGGSSAAIGVALLGDIYLNSYVAKLHLPPRLPAPVAHIARQSIGAANAVAAKLPAPLAGQVRGEAHAAFMSGLDSALLLAAGGGPAGSGPGGSIPARPQTPPPRQARPQRQDRSSESCCSGCAGRVGDVEEKR